MKRFGICLFLLLLSAPLTIRVMAAPLEKNSLTRLTWKDCVNEALKNHPDVKAAREELNQAKADKVISKSSFLPQISGNLSGRTSKTSAQNTTDTYSYGITGRQLLFDGLKTPYDIASAQKNIKAAQYNYEVTSSNVRLRLRGAFIELLKARELLNITEDIAGRRKKNLELVELRYEAGREHKGSLLTARANMAQAEFEVTRAKRAIDLAQRWLTKELGRPQLTPIRVKGDFKLIYANREEPDFERLSRNNPFLQELIAKKEAVRFGVKSTQAGFFPEVYASASAGRTDAYWPPHKEQWSAGLTLSLPIFKGGSQIAKVSKAKAALNQARANERSGRDSVILTLEQTWKELQDAINKVEVRQKFLEAARERARITQAQYSTGLISFDNWTIIEDGLVSAKKTFLDVQADALIREAGWIQAKGGTLYYE